MEKVISYPELQTRLSENEKSYLLLYKSGSEQSFRAYQNLKAGLDGQAGINVYTADVAEVKDIHSNYGISSAPSLLVFSNDNLVNIIKGCQESSFYRALTENKIFQPEKAGEGKPVRRVTVYSTPTCSWCNTLKAWLQKNNIQYRDIDVSRDEHAAEELVKRSGQQGVPQTEINGQIVVGFNQPRLQELLGI